ncbi:hypothetical protein D047_3068A, partial [Vibrio parahaemolyticus VPTS-2010_2]
MLRIISADK